MYFILVDPSPWCSNPFGYVNCISTFAGSIDRQGQTLLLSLMLSIFLGACNAMKERHKGKPMQWHLTVAEVCVISGAASLMVTGMFPHDNKGAWTHRGSCPECYETK